MTLYTEEEVKAMKDKFKDELNGKPCMESNGCVYIPRGLEFSEQEYTKSTGFFGTGSEVIKGLHLDRVTYQTIKTPDNMVTFTTSTWQKDILDEMYVERNRFRKVEHELKLLGFKLEHPKKEEKKREEV